MDIGTHPAWKNTFPPAAERCHPNWKAKDNLKVELRTAVAGGKMSA